MFGIETDIIIYSSAAVLVIAVYVFMLWRIFLNAGTRAWYSLIPILNAVKLIQIAGRPAWWFLLLFLPLINLIIILIIFIDLSKQFGRSSYFSLILLILNPIGMAILAFSSNEYVG